MKLPYDSKTQNGETRIREPMKIQLARRERNGLTLIHAITSWRIYDAYRGTQTEECNQYRPSKLKNSSTERGMAKSSYMASVRRN